jgi:hypothetical protein
MPLKKTSERVFRNFSSLNLGRTSENTFQNLFSRQKNFEKYIPKFFFSRTKLENREVQKICKGWENNFSANDKENSKHGPSSFI